MTIEYRLRYDTVQNQKCLLVTRQNDNHSPGLSLEDYEQEYILHTQVLQDESLQVIMYYFPAKRKPES